MADRLSLPSETLCTIFAHLRYRDLEGFTVYRDLVVASLVCTWWRQVAIEDSSLWDDIIVSFAQYSHVPAFIARAKSRPLSIRLIFDDYGHQLSVLRGFISCLDVISGHWNHIRALSFKLGERCDQKIAALASSWIGSFSPNLGLPSSLESLHIHRELRCNHFSFIAALLSSPVPDSLKVVHLKGSPLPADFRFSTLRNLTQLSLDSTQCASSPTSAHILDILRSSPDLEVLHLKTFTTSNGMSLIKPVSLPRLRYLALTTHNDMPDMLMLFGKSDISPSASVPVIVQTYLSMQPPIFLPLGSFVSTLRTSEVSILTPDEVLIIEAHAVRSNGSSKDGPVYIQYTYPMPIPTPSKETVNKTLLKIMESMAWIRPPCLKIDIARYDGGPPSVLSWMSLFSLLSTLESIEVQLACGRDGQETVRETEAAISLISALSPEPVVCPHLRRIVFPAIDRNQLTERFLEILKECMESRESRGLPSVDVSF
ncbi:hypothetical protein BD410DRAFT_901010 [Rickenella mellea]|uniref:F-box domain-containing protein n=1 Tax=Rickenella mellea TaxID=50990 RepID=A0A4Y7PRT5_9AGAM|nr:hypothetical protein BD410DRAFT_901010 [Rickenella mellea]